MSNAIYGIGILVCYYKDHKSEVVREFQSILRKCFTTYKLVIVNNDKVPITSQTISSSSIIELAGTNDAWEFSGWDEGFNYARSHSLLSGNTPIIFANDTFYSHRYFNLFNKHCFISKFKNNLKDDVLIGDLNHMGAKFTFSGITMNEWISTYLFAVKSDTL